MENSKVTYIIFFILSALMHGYLFVQVDAPSTQSKQSSLKIRSIEFITKKGSKESYDKSGPDKISRKDKENYLEDLRLSDLKDTSNPIKPSSKNMQKMALKSFQKKSNNSSAKMMTEYIKGRVAQHPNNILKLLDQSNASVSFGFENGKERDEFNTEELVYYGFRRRLKTGYVTSFLDKLNEFSLQNPHLDFPMTKNKQVMTGLVTYDQEGNIVRIKMMKWSERQRLQDFFLTVLNSLGKLPNPPSNLVKDGELSVFYTLNVN